VRTTRPWAEPTAVAGWRGWLDLAAGARTLERVAG
jgi:DNA polymerase-3 subunit epsilon